MFDVWWRWYGSTDKELVLKLGQSLSSYYDWCMEEHKVLGYAPIRIRSHRGQAMLYLNQGMKPRT